MADETLTKAGLHFDDLNKLRVLEPEVSSQSSDLNDECKDFLSKMMQFQSITSNFSKSLGSVALAVNKSKLEAIGSRNQLRSMAKERESQQQQLKILIFEKKMELERLKVHYDSLVKMEQQQNELIEQFALSN